ncbi:hypothetical protein ACHAXS_001158 [Conticribra weissflogii]
MKKFRLQDSMFNSRERVASVVNMGTNQTHLSRESRNGWNQESKE